MKMMKTTRWRVALPWAAMCVVAGLAGCASPPPAEPSFPRSYVVLLSSPDGSSSMVTVSGAGGEQTLAAPGAAAAADGSPIAVEVSAERLARDFGAAQSARPELPEHFLLYFETGGTQLVPSSEVVLQEVLARIRDRAGRGALEVSIVGHSDTVGSADVNARVSLERARWVEQRLRALGAQVLLLEVASHGESNLLVPTPDETVEPRNRRVEITLR